MGHIDKTRMPPHAAGACGVLVILFGLAGVSGQSASPLSGSCYRDTDCQYYHKDSSGLVTGQVVGTCEKRSESLSMCKCLPAYTGKNCEFKRCPVALETEFMCNGVQGEGTDYYGPVKGLYMGSEWNTYDEVRTVDNHIQSYLSTTTTSSAWIAACGIALTPLVVMSATIMAHASTAPGFVNAMLVGTALRANSKSVLV